MRVSFWRTFYGFGIILADLHMKIARESVLFSMKLALSHGSFFALIIMILTVSTSRFRKLTLIYSRVVHITNY